MPSASANSPQRASSHHIGYCPVSPATHGPLERTRGVRGTRLPHEATLPSGTSNMPVHTGPSCAGPDGVEWTTVYTETQLRQGSWLSMPKALTKSPKHLLKAIRVNVPPPHRPTPPHNKTQSKAHTAGQE